MAELKRSEKNAYEYRKKQKDMPPPPDYRKSIVEMRWIYSNLTDLEFISMYSRKYEIPAGEVSRVLKKYGGQKCN